MSNVETNTYEKYAIFQTGGKQYQAVEGKTIAIEKIEGTYFNVMGLPIKELYEELLAFNIT